jgi:hypothetical protein
MLEGGMGGLDGEARQTVAKISGLAEDVLQPIEQYLAYKSGASYTAADASNAFGMSILSDLRIPISCAFDTDGLGVRGKAGT